ncbi:hypothetical protein B0H21DRAFT_823184 [Amylocystis lapponica]|nr:hypothetical protein B0H21DRAFT_823184 [Amylocystis lapponica]
MGKVRDMARRLSYVRVWTTKLRKTIETARHAIYSTGLGIASAAVERLLKVESLTPTVNAFASALGDQFDVFSLLVVDFMHEIELGVWKALFAHLIRLLYAAVPSGSMVVELDSRFRRISTFGRGTIRRFTGNVSEMRKLAARDFEDLLQNDPAGTKFIPKLKDHLLSRLLGLAYDGDEKPFSEADRDTVCVLKDTMYFHKVFRVNYTTYDVRRDQDSMNPRTHCDIMLNSCETGSGTHPFWYARILGIFHVDVLHLGSRAVNRSVQKMEVLWVQWFGIDPDHRYGSKVARLPKVGFISASDESAFGFVDPSLVIRGCHLIPAFADGRTSELLLATNSIARLPGETDDWASYYVNIFVDRDMFMRYSGGGIGHISPSGDEEGEHDEGTSMAPEDSDNDEAMDVEENIGKRDGSDEESGDREEDGSDNDEGEDDIASDSEGSTSNSDTDDDGIESGDGEDDGLNTEDDEDMSDSEE